MKLQSLTVIFVIIVVPLSLILSVYIQSQIDSIVLQSAYDSKLINATYDAIKAFQLNTINSDYSTVSDSKIRDIEASINTFFNSLSSNLGLSGYKQNTLKPYIPAIVYTLYDGYYIYAPYQNTETGTYIHGLKPYIYYTCRYKRDNTDVVINYTLDNYIIIYGTVKGNYVTKAGYLINGTNAAGTNYKGISIAPERLEENILITGENVTTYQYVYRDGEKIYTNGNGKWFRYVTTNYIKVEVPAPTSVLDTSAIEYYKEAYEFTNWINNNLGNIQAKDAQDIYKIKVNNINQNTQNESLFLNDNSYIFRIDNNNDPEKEDSFFNEHRREVIKNSIQTNLNTAMANYNENSQALGSTYDFKMPIIAEVEWDKIINNVCAVSFMQGLTIGYKIYNNYCIIPNNINKEFISKESIKFVDSNKNVHAIGCTKNLDTTYNFTGYSNIDLLTKAVEKDVNIQNYYPHNGNRCYYCMVDSNFEYDFKDVIFQNSVARDKPIPAVDIPKLESYKKSYYHAIARLKYNLYKVNAYLNEN